MKTMLTAILCLFSPIVFGQVFVGENVSKEKDNYRDNYRKYCELKINNDSSIFLIYHNEGNSDYHEYAGNMKRINDTLYKISATSTFDKSIFEGHDEGILTITDDSNFVTFNKIILKYKDGYKATYDLNKSPVTTKNDSYKDDNDNIYHYYSREIRLDPKHFHYRDSLNSFDGYMQRVTTTDVYLDIEHKSPISGKPVYFMTGDCGNEIHFGGRETSFSIINKKGGIKLITENLYDSDPFILTKKQN